MNKGFLRNLLRNTKGISMVSLVITIIVVIILVAITVRLAFPTIEKANYSEFANQISSIESKTRTMQLQLEKEKRNDYSLEALGFRKVTLNRVPWNYRSADETRPTGYVVDLDILDLSSISRGRAHKSIGSSATFGEDDVFIVDGIGKVYYLKGFTDTQTNTSYFNTYTTKSEGVSGPRITNVEYALINDNQAALVTLNVASEFGKQLTVYVDGERATNVSGSKYEAVVNRNGKIGIRVQETDGLLTLDSTPIEGIIAPDVETPAPLPTDVKPTGPSKTTGPIMTKDPGKTTNPILTFKPTSYPTVLPTGDVGPTPTAAIETKIPKTLRPSTTPIQTQTPYTPAPTPTPTPMPVTVLVNIHRDGEPWESSSMSVHLYQDGVKKYTKRSPSGATGVTFTAAPGTYQIYADEMLGLNRLAWDTGITINATQDVEATIDYYYIPRPVIAKGTSLYVNETGPEGRSITYGYSAPGGAGALSGIGSVLKGVPVYAVVDKYQQETMDAFLKINDEFVESPITIIMSEPLAFESVAGYAVRYDANGGELEKVPSFQVKQRGVTLFLTEETPSRKGYLFRGWATSNDAINPTYPAKSSNIYTADATITLYAVWAVDPEGGNEVLPEVTWMPEKTKNPWSEDEVIMTRVPTLTTYPEKTLPPEMTEAPIMTISPREEDEIITTRVPGWTVPPYLDDVKK